MSGDATDHVAAIRLILDKMTPGVDYEARFHEERKHSIDLEAKVRILEEDGVTFRKLIETERSTVGELRRCLTAERAELEKLKTSRGGRVSDLSRCLADREEQDRELRTLRLAYGKSSTTINTLQAQCTHLRSIVSKNANAEIQLRSALDNALAALHQARRRKSLVKKPKTAPLVKKIKAKTKARRKS